METQTAAKVDSQVSQILLMVGAALAVLFGGTISLDSIRVLDGSLLAGIFGGNELPLLQHALIGAFFGSSLLITLVTRRVIILPPSKISIAGFWFLSVLALSCLSSQFLSTSLTTLFEWTLYGAAFLAAISCLGRTTGPLRLAQVVVAAIAILALIGIREYGQMKAVDPSWRIFAGWMNPNILGGLLLLGMFPAFGLIAAAEKPIEKLIWGLLAIAIGFAIVLTQSRGALLSGLGGVIILLILSIRRNRGLALAAAATFSIVVLLSFAQSTTAADPGTQVAASRIGAVAATQTQSVGFRVELWKTAVDLMKSRPAGYGLGTFQFVSGSPGRVTKTTLAHNTYLQLGAEASVVAPLLLVFVILGCVGTMVLRQHPSRPPGNNVALSIAAGLLAGLANNLQDSHMYHFGYGIIFALLLAVGMQLSADGTMPEILPKSLRYAGALGAATIPIIGLVYFGTSEYFRATRNVDGLKSMPLAEGANFAAIAQLEPSREFLIKAVGAAPTSKNLRRLATTYIAAGEVDTALPYLLRARRLEPSDPLTLLALWQVYRSNGNESARRAIVAETRAADKSSYGLIRSLPDLVPTEPAEIRLNESQIDPREAAELRQEAAAIYRDYYLRTWPQIKAMPSEIAAQVGYAGERLPEAVSKLKALRELAELLPSDKRVDSVALDKDISDAEEALATLNIR